MNQTWLSKIVNNILRNTISKYILIWIAKTYRKLIKNVVFIGITGSCGKTVTKDLIDTILSTRYMGIKNPYSLNALYSIIKTTFKTRPWHQFCVLEIGGGKPDAMNDPISVIMPNIAIVTNIGFDHYNAFRSLKAIATEKSKLIKALTKNGTAILNIDDSYVLAMKELTNSRIITYGLSEKATMRAVNIYCEWPERLSFTVMHNNESLQVKTNLLGTHWVYSVLASLAVGLIMKIPLKDGIKAVEKFNPIPGRMNPVYMNDEVVFIRDDWKSSLLSIEPAFEFMKKAKATRKIAIIGTITDFPGQANKTYNSVVKKASTIFDKVIFTSPFSHNILRLKGYSKDDTVLTFNTLKNANDYIQDFIKEGDLVLLKGSINSDHLERIILARKSEVGCWRSNCNRLIFCSDCNLLNKVSLPNHKNSNK